MDVPDAVVDRLVTFHLLDKMLGCGFFWEKATGDIKLTVTDVADGRVKMSLRGSARLGKKTDYPVMLGNVEYDSAAEKFTRFDMIALGKDDGDFRTDEGKIARNNFWYRISRPGARWSMAIAFELVDGTRVVDRVPPYGIMFESHRDLQQAILSDGVKVRFRREGAQPERVVAVTIATARPQVAEPPRRG